MITLFLADDHAIVREGLRLLLEAQPDLKVIGEAANGREAVRQMAHPCPDIAILDIAMPDLNGIEAIAQLYEVCPATRVIILSMYATKGHIARALQAGARGYLLKASSGSEIIKAVYAVQAGHHYLSQEISDRVISDYLHQQKSPDMDNLLALLSPREREILQLIVEGKSSADVATLLALSPSTVETYRSRLMRKLSLTDFPSLVKFAIRQGLISLE